MQVLCFHLIFHINEWTHVKLLRESHAVVQLDAMHSGVIEIKAFQLECQQVGKVQKSQTLCREALINGQGRTIAELSSIKRTEFSHLPGVTFLFASFTEVLIGPIQGFWLDKCLQSLFLWQKKLLGVHLDKG